MGAAAIIWAKYKWHIIIGLLLIAIVLFIYYSGRRDEKRKSSVPDPIPLPAGVDLPTGWTATPVAIKLHEAMDGFWTGTDNDAVREALSNLNDAQLVAVYNEFNNKYSKEGYGTLLDWFEGDLSGDDLSWALDKFSGLV